MDRRRPICYLSGGTGTPARRYRVAKRSCESHSNSNFSNHRLVVPERLVEQQPAEKLVPKRCVSLVALRSFRRGHASTRVHMELGLLFRDFGYCFASFAPIPQHCNVVCLFRGSVACLGVLLSTLWEQVVQHNLCQ